MKKSILLLLVSGSCLVAAAQTPDTTRLQQLNVVYPPDSTVITPQVAPVEAAPPATTVPDTMNIPPAQPVNTDVKNSEPLADTINVKTTLTEPSVPDTNTDVIPIVPLPSGDTMLTTVPAVPAPQETMPPQQTMPAEQTVSNTNYNLPRGVNNPESTVLLTGLNKWSALPILNTYVPQDVVDKLKMEHGDKLYDITMLKTGESQYGYSARVQENGIYRTVMVNGNTTAANQ